MGTPRGTLLDSVDVISVTTDQLGDYAVTARLLNSVKKAAGAFRGDRCKLETEQFENVGSVPSLSNSPATSRRMGQAPSNTRSLGTMERRRRYLGSTSMLLELNR
jgi:hypothetical protein